ncbi:response regulator [Hymenobacter sublimis]|uniref:Response regulator n=1 Tax=Hymenobacter sublimis TaxID=2933777 RepID=A0ABY4J4N8_9BACT|nr:response regulator [Hymenobacter sublimis]UPL47765.1 response regulator [Hymenobacter sublimis]
MSHPPVAKAPKLVYVIENDRISSVISELIVKKNLLSSEVQTYTNGQQAFDQLQGCLQQQAPLPDLILLDLDMPLMDGWEFLDACATLALPHPVNIFILTSSINPEDSSKLLAHREVKGFFTKPLNEEGIRRMQLLLQEV